MRFHPTLPHFVIIEKKETKMLKEDERRANARLALINVGKDATLEDCRFFNRHNFKDPVPFDTKDLDAVRQKLTATQVMDTKVDREESLLRQLGKKLIAKVLLENTEGRLALRDEMSRLQIDGLRDLLGFGSPDGVSDGCIVPRHRCHR